MGRQKTEYKTEQEKEDKTEQATQPSKFICLNCGRSLECATSICTCGGRATRRPRSEQELEDEHNSKVESLWKTRKMCYMGSILFLVLSLLSIGLVMINHILGTVTFVLAMIGFVSSVIWLLVKSSCPYCGRSLDPRLLSEHIICCPYCGKRIIKLTSVSNKNQVQSDPVIEQEQQQEEEKNDNINFWL